mgnify:CR=1 FL=1
MALPSIVLLTDFGDGNGSGAMIGVCKRVEPALALYELTNDVPRFDVAGASRLIADQIPAWPPGTVFVCAVDPASGAGGRVLACRTPGGSIVVGPDNGCFADTATQPGIAEARSLAWLNAQYLLMEPSGPSHGRNLAYCAACLAAGKPRFDEAGEPVDPAELKRSV